jgi:hypothetical protein
MSIDYTPLRGSMACRIKNGNRAYVCCRREWKMPEAQERHEEKNHQQHRLGDSRLGLAACGGHHDRTEAPGDIGGARG